MIHSSGGKSYDTADGSEQPHASSARTPVNEHRSEINRWADDGAPARVRIPPGAVRAARKPLWSVLTLRHLGELLRLKRAARPLAPPPPPRGPTQSDVQRAQAVEERGDAHAAAMKEYYRNAWEHT